MLFFCRVEGLYSLLVHYGDCATCWYSRGTVLFVGTVEGLCCLLVQ